MDSVNLAALYYDTYMSAYQEDLPYWLALAARYPGPVLELGCGSGRVAKAMLEAGLHYTGIDSDPEMLAICRARLQSHVSPDAFHEANMTGFELGRRFSLIISPCNTFSTLDAGQRRATLWAIRVHLVAGGCFAACLPNPHALAEAPPVSEAEPEGSFTHPLSGNPVQVSTAYERREDWFELRWHFDHLLPDGHVERTTITTHHAITSRRVYLAELASVGFSVRAQAGNFDGAAFTPGSPAWLWEAVLAV